MPWTINSEIYPMWARGTGNAIATMVNWAFNLVVSFSFLTMLENITKYGRYGKLNVFSAQMSRKRYWLGPQFPVGEEVDYT